MKITISGTLGSGKSTVAKMLAEKLKYNHYSAGQIVRKISEEKNMPTFLDTMKLAEQDLSIDKKIDSYQIELGKKEDNFVLEGRLGFHFIPESVKVFLKCNEKIAAQRVLKSLKDKENLKEKDPYRLKESLKEDEESIIKSFNERRDSENKRYMQLYGIKQDDESKFDIVIDTTTISPEEVCEKILDFIKRKQTKKGRKR